MRKTARLMEWSDSYRSSIDYERGEGNHIEDTIDRSISSLSACSHRTKIHPLVHTQRNVVEIQV